MGYTWRSVSLPEETTIVTDVHKDLPERKTDDCLVLIYAHDVDAQGRRFRLRRGPLRIGRLDSYGHLTGDHVLHELAQRVAGVSAGEAVARYGGEELAVILPETGLGQACVLAEKLRHAIASEPFVFQGHAVDVTVSIGCAARGDGDRTASDLVARADEMVYQAKPSGRDRVCG